MACIKTSFVRLLIAADASVLDTLLEIGDRNFDIDDMIENEMPALHFAVIFRRVDVVKVLLKHGANVNLEDKDGNTCLHLALQTSVWPENVERVQKILKDVILDSACKQKLTAPFSTDAETQQSVPSFFEISDRSIIQSKPPVRYADFVIDNTSLIELLLSSGANPNHQNCIRVSCSTPLLTCDCKHIGVINLLLQYGADVNIKDNYGDTVLGCAAEYGTVEVVEKLLDAGADVNELSSGDLPLSRASYNESGNEVIVSIIKLLISRGADVNALNPRGYTPLKEAVRYSSLQVVEHLLKLGANPNLYEGNAPLLYTSIIYDNVEITECLLNYGADAFYKSLDGSSLLNIAMQERTDLLDDDVEFDFDVASKLVTLLMERGVTIGEHDYTDLTPEKIELLEKCQHQLQTLKETKIYPDSPTTYFDFLLKRGKKLVRCLRDENIAAAFKSEEYKKEFVYFAHRLEANYDRGLKYVYMIDDLRSILSDVFKDDFPEELIIMISDYFSLEDLKKCFGDQFNA